MKQVFVIATIFLTACYGKTEKKKPAPGKEIIAAVYQKDGLKKLDWVLRLNEDKVKTDSATGKKSIVSETLYGVWMVITYLDSLKQPLKTKAGKDSVFAGWVAISKDSVNTHIENIPIDSLLKK